MATNVVDTGVVVGPEGSSTSLVKGERIRRRYGTAGRPSDALRGVSLDVARREV